MNKTLEKMNENKIVLAILLSAFIIGIFIYFSFNPNFPSTNVLSVIEGDKSIANNDAVSACNAGNYTGQEKTVEGKVIDAYKSKTNTVFLNFGRSYPNQCFTAVIFSSDLTNFQENPQNYYKGKLLRIRGIIEEYEGKPEIKLMDISQIEVLR